MGNINAKEELLDELQTRELKCANIRNITPLKVDYTKEEYEEFLEELDFNYDDGYGSQNIFGVLWFKDNTWATRGEYDGSEWWELHSLPEIPEELQ